MFFLHPSTSKYQNQTILQWCILLIGDSLGLSHTPPRHLSQDGERYKIGIDFAMNGGYYYIFKPLAVWEQSIKERVIYTKH
jgi:hypothetical protein